MILLVDLIKSEDELDRIEFNSLLIEPGLFLEKVVKVGGFVVLNNEIEPIVGLKTVEKIFLKNQRFLMIA